MFRRGVVVAFAVALLVTGASALDVPPPPSRWLTDQAGLLDASQGEALNQKLSTFEQQSGAQFIIYVFPALDGEALEDFTIRCAEKWKVGNKKYDNGLILFVFVKEKKVRIEVGYGLEKTITDAFASRVIRNEIAPPFRNGDYGGGLNAAADAIMNKIRTGEEPVAPVQPRNTSTPRAATPGGADIIGVLVILAIFFLVILPLLSRSRGCGGCGGCWWPLLFTGGGRTFGGGGGGWSGGGGGGWSGGGGFSGGGGSFGGGGASGGW